MKKLPSKKTLKKEVSTTPIAKVRGRPMLYWVGKQSLAKVSNYPAQLSEVWNGTEPLAAPTWKALTKDWRNLLLHGDNKEILSMLLVEGFRGKIDLIYIDPPFDSGADYVRQVELRGEKIKFEGMNQSLSEQTQYTDIWKNDTYLQFMYERLQLLRELLSEQGSIYLHCDWRKSHHLRSILDEVFGQENFIREIIWNKGNVSGFKSKANNWIQTHDSIFFYKKGGKNIFNKLHAEYSEEYLANFNQIDQDGRRYWQWSSTERRYIDKLEGLAISDVWQDEAKDFSSDDTFEFDTWNIPYENNMSKNRTDYPTQKPEALLERIIKASSNPDSIVLDCFAGSGTTMSVSQKLGRRWIGCDINRGAIQVSLKRLAQVITEQRIERKKSGDLFEKPETKLQEGILSYRVNNYDFQREEAWRAVAIQKYGITETPTDGYFDGLLGDRLVKFVPMNRPIIVLDAEEALREMKRREHDPRNIILIGNGAEVALDSFLAEKGRLTPINKVEYKDIMRDGIHAFTPAEASVVIERVGKKATVTIHSYLSPTILARMSIDRTIFGERLKDFRAQIDTVMIDTDYDDKVFHVHISDIPQKKQDFVQGTYELILSRANVKVAVKITDMLGEETLVVL